MDDSCGNLNTDRWWKTRYVTHRVSYKSYGGRNRPTILRPFFHLYETQCINVAHIDRK